MPCVLSYGNCEILRYVANNNGITTSKQPNNRGEHPDTRPDTRNITGIRKRCMNVKKRCKRVGANIPGSQAMRPDVWLHHYEIL
jgi:hypothetical protein